MTRAPFFALGLALASYSLSPTTAAAPAGGTIVVRTRATDGSPVAPRFEEALSAALNAKGFTILSDPDHVGYLAEISVSQDAVGTAMEKDHRESAGLAGGAAYLPLQSGGYTASALRRTRLEISIRKREGEVVWHGAAVTVRPAGTTRGMNAAVAQDLSRALLSAYPDEPQDVVGVP